MMRLAALVSLSLTLALPAAAAPVPNCGGVDLSQDPSVHPDLAAHADDLINAEGLLWRIDKPGLAPSYLYGTMHSTQPGPMRLAREAAPYAEKAASVATELGDIDASAKIELGATLLREAASPDVDTFAGLIEGEDVAKVESLLASRGTPPEMAHHLKLWMTMVAASLPLCEAIGQANGSPEVDQSFAEIASAHGHKAVALESVDEQLRAITSLPPELSATMLKSMASNRSLADGGYQTLLSLYLKKEPAMAIAVLDAAPGLSDADRKASAEATKDLLGGRNAVMAERASPLLAKGGAFIAVGALHLSGKDGLVERFRALGYTVTKVW